MNILVTGGSGFIGFEAAKRFKSKGHDVVILDNNPDPKKWMEAQDLGIKKVNESIHNIDRHNNPIFPGVKFDVILHTAAQTAVTKSMQNPLNDFYQNALGTYKICEYAKQMGSHLLFTSTNKVYGNNVNKINVRQNNTRWEFVGRDVCIEENFPIDNAGHSPYGCSKLAADIYVQDLYHTWGIPSTVFRMSCIYGASQKGTEDQGWVYHITKQCLNDQPINIYGDGKQVRDILYVDDLIDAFEAAIEKKAKGVFNIGGGLGNTVSIIELMHKVYNEKLIKNCTFLDWRPSDQKVYISNITKASTILNWKPKISVDEGLEKLKEAF